MSLFQAFCCKLSPQVFLMNVESMWLLHVCPCCCLSFVHYVLHSFFIFSFFFPFLYRTMTTNPRQHRATFRSMCLFQTVFACVCVLESKECVCHNQIFPTYPLPHPSFGPLPVNSVYSWTGKRRLFNKVWKGRNTGYKYFSL